MSQRGNMNRPPSSNYFELFGLAEGFVIDLARLDEAYRALQSRFHPDRFANTSEAHRARSLQLSTHINTAYSTLRHPLARARHLLELAGVDPAPNGGSRMPADFLIEQMQWREEMEGAGRTHDATALRDIGRRMREKAAAQERILARLLEPVRDLESAADCLQKLGFYDSLLRDLNGMIAAVEDHCAV
jgi:molecular chaperone HscB